MKVFAMNDCDWMAAETLEQAKEAYLRDYWGSNPEAFDDPYEVSDEAMDTMLFHDDDGTVRTFRQQLAKETAEGRQFPCFFASTEY